MTAEEVSRRFGISRDEQDAFAAESQARAAAGDCRRARSATRSCRAAAGEKGGPASFDTDEHPRPGTVGEKLGGLEAGVHARGDRDRRQRLGHQRRRRGARRRLAGRGRRARPAPLARVLSYAVVGVEPIVMGLGPIGAVRLALERAGLAVSDIDLFELNEAFAAQALAVSRELGLDGAQGERARRRHRARPPDRRQRRPPPDHPDLRAARPRRRPGRRLSLHWRRDGDRDGGRGRRRSPAHRLRTRPLEAGASAGFEAREPWPGTSRFSLPSVPEAMARAACGSVPAP